MSAGRTPKHHDELPLPVLAELARLRLLGDGRPTSITLPTLETFLRDPRAADAAAAHVENELFEVTGRKIRFRSREKARQFCESTGILGQFITDPARFIECVAFPERLTVQPPDPPSFHSAQLAFPLSIGTYNQYANCIAAILERFFRTPAESFHEGWIAFSGNPQAVTAQADWRAYRPISPTKFAARPKINGANWIDVFRKWFNGSETDDSTLSARARRGRLALASQPAFRFMALTIKIDGLPPRTAVDLAKALVGQRPCSWCETWYARHLNSGVIARLKDGPAHRTEFKARDFFRLPRD